DELAQLDPLQLARRLLEEVQEEAVASLLGAPEEAEARPVAFDPAGLAAQTQLLGAPVPPEAPLSPEVAGFAPQEPPGFPPEAPAEFAPRPPWMAVAEPVQETQPTAAQPASEKPPRAKPPWKAPAEPAPEPPPEFAPRPPWMAADKPTSEAPAEFAPRPPWMAAAEPVPEASPELAARPPWMAAAEVETVERAPRPPWRAAEDSASREQRPTRERPVESTRDAGDVPRPTPLIAPPSGTLPVASAALKPGAMARLRAEVRDPSAPRTSGFLQVQWDRIRALFDRRMRITGDDIVVFTRQFAAMVTAGLQLHHALQFYADSHEESGLGKVIDDVAMRVSSGATLSSSMQRHPEVFSEVYSGLMAAGETTGMMVAILAKLADLSERNQRMRKKVSAALAYPTTIMVVSVLCLAVFVWVVLPMFMPIFSQMGMQLPLPTRVLFAISQAGRNPYVVGGVILAALLLWLSVPLLRGSGGGVERRRLHRFILGLPYVGGMVRKLVNARVLFSLATLLEAGIPLTTCLEKCERVAGNAEVAYRLRMARDSLVDGDSAADSLGRFGVFPNGAIQMIAVGEETAQMSEMIRRVAEVYEDDVELALMDFASIIEPAILLVMGGIVGFIVLACVLPSVKLLEQL
ncbi:MAG: type II secretion system F family protein, partial [Candidatus Eremiobacterota bacterium]